MDTEPGFEPGFTVSKTAVLPLDDSVMVLATGVQPASIRLKGGGFSIKLHQYVVSLLGVEPR